MNWVNKNKFIIIITIIYLLLGIIIGNIIGDTWRNGYFVNWKKLDGLDDKIVKIVDVYEHSIIVETEDGQWYLQSDVNCRNNNNKCWELIDQTQSISSLNDYDCSVKILAHNPPLESKQCVQGIVSLSFYTRIYDYSLLSDGGIWYWSYSYGEMSLDTWFSYLVQYIIFPIVGLFFGIIFGKRVTKR